MEGKLELANEKEERKFVVYCHKLKTDGRTYIGITGQKPSKRWGDGRLYYGSPHFYYAIQKYGWNSFEHIILYEHLTKDEACEKEKELIAKYKTQDSKYGFNLTGGGDGMFDYHYTEEQIKHRSERLMGHKLSEETKAKISKAHKGMKMPPRSEEYKMNVSKRQKGRKMPKEIVEKKQKYELEKHGKPVNQLDMNGNFIKRFEGLRVAAREMGNVKRYTDIRRICNKEYGKKSAFGYKWEYASKTL